VERVVRECTAAVGCVNASACALRFSLGQALMRACRAYVWVECFSLAERVDHIALNVARRKARHSLGRIAHALVVAVALPAVHAVMARVSSCTVDKCEDACAQQSSTSARSVQDAQSIFVTLAPLFDHDEPHLG
jgi:hypothetical protein